MSDELRYAAQVANDALGTRFMRRVSFDIMRKHRLHMTRFEVSPEVWGLLVAETDFGTCPGSRVRDDLELMLPGGWAAVLVDPSLERTQGVAVAGQIRAPLDFEGVLV